jgi:hypothetical protein
MDERSYPLTPGSIQSAAQVLLQSRHGPDASIGNNWTNRFIHRHPTLRSRYTRHVDRQRAKCEDPVLIQKWFDLVHNIIKKYGIAEADIYNFDETGFAIGVATHSARVVTSSDRRGKPTINSQVIVNGLL